ncbi:MAG TPA: glycine cleavage system protein GcvH [Mobilitalea sp.]|nr:glycine cleavage system protein GcvH [Mobilitalea sp.]
MKKEFLFTKSHEWVEFLDDTTARVGISNYAQSELGDLVFINLPEVEDEMVVGEVFADVESVKAVSDIYSPLSGTVRAINEELLDQPEFVNSNPFEAWFVEVGDITDKADLMSENEYQKMIKID